MDDRLRELPALLDGSSKQNLIEAVLTDESFYGAESCLSLMETTEHLIKMARSLKSQVAQRHASCCLAKEKRRMSLQTLPWQITNFQENLWVLFLKFFREFWSWFDLNSLKFSRENIHEFSHKWTFSKRKFVNSRIFIRRFPLPWQHESIELRVAMKSQFFHYGIVIFLHHLVYKCRF